jgi:cytochrome c
VSCASAPPAAEDARAGLQELVAPAAGKPRLLVYSRTQGFRHDSIPAGITALSQLAAEQGLGLSGTEDADQFTDATLAPFAAVIFLSTTGDVLNDEQQAAFERYIAAGHGYVGIHAAADCEYDWPFYGELVGAWFKGHSQVTRAQLKVEPLTHPAVAGLTSPWSRDDEWYGFGENPRPNVTVLLTVDETSYDPGQGQMGADHPVAWYHEHQGGRAFYTALGHTTQTFTDAAFTSHLFGGIQWAARLAP